MQHRCIRRLGRLAALVAALAALPAGSAQAAVVELDPCDDAQLSRAFSQWGDPALYKLAPGGDFESGLAGATVRGDAAIVADSEPYGVTGAVGTKALQLAPGSSVTLPATCVNAGNPAFRFFSRSSGGLLGLVPLLKVDVVYRDNLLGLVAIPAGTALPSSSWRPSLHNITASLAGAAVDGGVAQMSIRFTAVTGTWRIDDALVDPYRRI